MSRHVVVNGKMRHLQGWKKEPADHRDFRLSSPTPTLPPRADLRPLGPPVGDQGQIGSCTANGGCEAMEFLEKQGQSDVLFSRLYLYYKTREKEGTPPSEDSGAQIRTVMAALADAGVCYEKTWPYENPEMRFSMKPPPMADTEAGAHKALFYYRCSRSDIPSAGDVFLMKASLAQGFPVVFGFSVPDNMMTDACTASGLVFYPTPEEGFQGGHCVVAMGYDDEKMVGTEKGAFLCQNSWGTGWGIGGFFWLPYRFVADGLASDPWTLRRAEV